MSLFAAGLAEMIAALLILLLGPIIQILQAHYATQKKKREVGQAGEKIIRATPENEELVLEETPGILYDLESLEILDDVPAKSKKPPKIRTKSNRKKAAGQPTGLPSGSVAGPVLAAAVEPVPQQAGANRPQPGPLAAELFKMFQTPAGVQQAVLAGEILKRRF